jgi:hypothetical protein
LGFAPCDKVTKLHKSRLRKFATSRGHLQGVGYFIALAFLLSQPCKTPKKALKGRNQKAIGDSLLRKGRNQKNIGANLLQKGRNQKTIGANLLQKKNNQKANKNTTQIAGTLQALAIFTILVRFAAHGCCAFAVVFMLLKRLGFVPSCSRFQAFH